MHKGDRTPVRAAGGGRLPALDGLRGIAAFIVVVHHCLLAAPAFSDAYLAPRPDREPAAAWALIYTPLHVLWAGTEAVLVFFVLSGFVLALPYVTGKAARWRAYYPQRLLRLYLPLAGATTFAVVIDRAVTRGPQPGVSGWLNIHASRYPASRWFWDAVTLRGVDNLNTAFWSLQWELWFSLLLPVFVVALVWYRRWPGAKAVLLLAMVLAGAWPGGHWPVLGVSLHAALLYLPVFGLGVIMARERDRLGELGAKVDAWPMPGKAAVGAAFLVLMFAWWAVAADGTHLRAEAVASALQVAAACLAVGWFAFTRSGERAGTGPIVAWLGRRSFSLYLVHEPIIVTTAFALKSTNPIEVGAIAIPLALAAAELFYRAVERPAHHLARWTGRRLRGEPVVPAAAQPQSLQGVSAQPPSADRRQAEPRGGR
jgi:peptidoglycan/LPS O-acetylase OafA/YrhL